VIVGDYPSVFAMQTHTITAGGPARFVLMGLLQSYVDAPANGAGTAVHAVLRRVRRAESNNFDAAAAIMVRRRQRAETSTRERWEVGT
jgi:hypothetical protein